MYILNFSWTKEDGENHCLQEIKCLRQKKSLEIDLVYDKNTILMMLLVLIFHRHINSGIIMLKDLQRYCNTCYTNNHLIESYWNVRYKIAFSSCVDLTKKVGLKMFCKQIQDHLWLSKNRQDQNLNELYSKVLLKLNNKNKWKQNIQSTRYLLILKSTSFGTTSI